MIGVLALVDNVIVLPVRADISIVPTLYEAFKLTVFPLVGYVDPIVAMSCANGNAVTSAVPPSVKDQEAVLFQFAAPELLHHTVLGASNVIPLFPLQSPNRVPLTGAAAPAMVMSRKSMSVSEATAAQVSVRVVPSVFDRTNVRMVALVPAESVRVPLMVELASKMMLVMPAVVLPAKDKLLYVFAPLTA